MKLLITSYAYVIVDKPNYNIPIDNAHIYENNKFMRDGKFWHITIVDPFELSMLIRNNITKNQAKDIFLQEMHVIFNEIVKSTPEYIGVGSTSDSRSEEHTSELQSQSNLVCRLLLEK